MKKIKDFLQTTLEKAKVFAPTKEVQQIRKAYNEVVKALQQANSGVKRNYTMSANAKSKLNGVQYDLAKSFSEQVDDVLTGKPQRYSDVYVMNTPQLLQDIGLRNLPMLMTAKHIKTINAQKDNAKHKHGVPIEIIKEIPNMISRPVMIMDSISGTPNNSIVIIGEKIVDGEPMLISVRVDGQGKENSIVIDSNFITSAYGRHNFKQFIGNNIKARSFLYVNKKRSQALFSVLGVQFPSGFNNLNFNTIIRNSNEKVNTQNENILESGKNDKTQYSLSDKTNIGIMLKLWERRNEFQSW